jgi:hypothetical protein
MATLTAAGITCGDGSNFNGTTFNTVGSVCLATITGTNTVVTSGTSITAGSGVMRMQSYSATMGSRNNLSGTWRYMGPNTTNDPCQTFPCVAVRAA